ncbi:MocR-like pyridoxine biosynthesis transcription factor PdxR [Pseudooceanicola sp. 502str34]
MSLLTAITRESDEPIQAQLRRSIVEAIHGGEMTPGQKMPPSRQLAGRLGIARNTVTAVYEELVARGYLESVPRQGYFVAERELREAAEPSRPQAGIDWSARLRLRPSMMRHFQKPANWQDYAYPFVYGQVDPRLFPINTWRACSRDALGRAAIDWWTADRAVEDDPLLVEQIRSQILPQRGIFARSEEILITLGAQEGLYLLARLLARPGTRVGCENPGYPDSRFIFGSEGCEMVDLPVDDEGARLDQAGKLDLAVLTPAHHCPSMVTMSPARRVDILDRARRDGTIIVEDDYEGETAFSDDGLTLKSQDRDGRVAYLGTMSKVLAPGVRLGFMVADAALVQEARWLRRMIHRSAPLNNQRTAGIFLAEGHYLTLIRNLRSALQQRFDIVTEGCARHLPEFRRAPSTGGSSVWLELPAGLEAGELVRRAMEKGVLAEPGDSFTDAEGQGRFLRLGISYIEADRIDAGLALLGQAAQDLG